MAHRRARKDRPSKARQRPEDICQSKQTKRRREPDQVMCRLSRADFRDFDLTSPIDVKMTSLREIGTDIWMACNALTHRASTGLLLNSTAPGGGRYGARGADRGYVGHDRHKHNPGKSRQRCRRHPRGIFRCHTRRTWNYSGCTLGIACRGAASPQSGTAIPSQSVPERHRRTPCIQGQTIDRHLGHGAISAQWLGSNAV